MARQFSPRILIVATGLFTVTSLLTCRAMAQDPGPLLIGLPDLIIASVSTTNATAAPGDSIAVSDVTKNLQNVTLNSFYDYLYICTSSNGLDASCYVTNHIVPVTLSAGATFSWSGTIVVPSGTALGTNWLCVVADGNNAIKESNPNNNTNEVMIIITP